MGDTEKHRNFVREPMFRRGNPKSVDELAGIGAKAKAQLQDNGLTHAHMLLGQLLVFDRSERMFLDFLADKAPCLNSHHTKACYNCLTEWCNLNL
eukprot:m.101596 g.101596  ORF g.101596 m.101596 type:complete len:95 (+) comp15176_c0_seq6:73-357(+)